MLWNKTKLESVSVLLRLGLAFAFFYAGLSSFFKPFSWVGYFPEFLIEIFGDQFLLIGFSIFELVLGILLVLNIKTFWLALISAAAMAGIVIFNFNQMDVVFRDVSIMLSALALARIETKDISTEPV